MRFRRLKPDFSGSHARPVHFRRLKPDFSGSHTLPALFRRLRPDFLGSHARPMRFRRLGPDFLGSHALPQHFPPPEKRLYSPQRRNLPVSESQGISAHSKKRRRQDHPQGSLMEPTAVYSPQRPPQRQHRDRRGGKHRDRRGDRCKRSARQRTMLKSNPVSAPSAAPATPPTTADAVEAFRTDLQFIRQISAQERVIRSLMRSGHAPDDDPFRRQ